jgi:cyclic-di-GMP phosphodiesterase TipF (flagellum assembly factor)
VVRSCLDQVLANASLLAEGNLADSVVHQLRVGIRRLRTAQRELGAWGGDLDDAWQAPAAETFRKLGPTESEHLAAMSQRGYRFSIDHVRDLRIDPRELAERGVRFIKVPAALLLDPKRSSASDIHPSDLSDLLGRFGIDLIAEKIEGERAVVDLLDYDVRFGQGFLFAPPRPLRSEAASANGGAPASKPHDPVSSGKPAVIDGAAIDPPRVTGNAALARRAAGLT